MTLELFPIRGLVLGAAFHRRAGRLYFVVHLGVLSLLWHWSTKPATTP